MIYVAVIWLTLQNSAWGFGAGFFIALFWNYANIFFTTFFKGGLKQLLILFKTGHLPRPDLSLRYTQ